MKNKIFSILKVLLPLGIGVYLIAYFYNVLSEEDKKQVFQAFKDADYFWVFISLLLSFMTFVIRAYRWRYLLRPMGYQVSFFKCYHSVMFGYLLNMLIPRAGEPGRAGILHRKAGVPFQKGFGTIIAERAIDMLVLAIIGLITLYYQGQNLDLIQERVNMYTDTPQSSSDGTGWMFWTLIILGALLVFIAIYYLRKATFRDKLINILKGLWEGIISIRKSKSIGAFIFFSLLIWSFYVLMFWVCFWALPETSATPPGGIMAAFIAGTLGIVFVQGGIGVFPALVGIVVTTYLFTDFQQPVHPVGFALGWIIWLSQTISIIVLGLISLIWIQKGKNHDKARSDQQ